MDNMTRDDDRLHNKTYVWGVQINGDAVCWTDDFVVENGNLINAAVGGRDLVIAWGSEIREPGRLVQRHGRSRD
jgi:hypothetical protein